MGAGEGRDGVSHQHHYRPSGHPRVTALRFFVRDTRAISKNKLRGFTNKTGNAVVFSGGTSRVLIEGLGENAVNCKFWANRSMISSMQVDRIDQNFECSDRFQSAWSGQLHWLGKCYPFLGLGSGVTVQIESLRDNSVNRNLEANQSKNSLMQFDRRCFSVSINFLLICVGQSIKTFSGQIFCM